jgi:glycosyltransferase involved in cell wall biosynthesis
MPLKKTISIVVPIYNVGGFLNQCIESLVNQTYSDLEIILVNDGSTDDSLRICRFYQENDSRILIIDQENKGLIRARKNGVRSATGEYVIYVDGDDWVEPTLVEHLLTCSEQSGSDLVAGGHLENLPGVVTVLQNEISPGVYDGQTLVDSVFPRMLCTQSFSQFGIFSYVWGKLFKRSLLVKHQLKVDEEIFIGEDAACLYPLLLECKKLHITEKALYHYRQRTDSLIKTPDPNEFVKISTLFHFLKSEFSKTVYYPILINQLQSFVLSLTIVRTDKCPRTFTGNTALFPFTDIHHKTKIAICGAGTLGQQLRRRFKNNPEFEIVIWVDELFIGYRNIGLPIESPHALLQHQFDYVLIAYIDESKSREVAESLVSMTVPNSKIKRINCDKNLLSDWACGFDFTGKVNEPVS